MIASEELHHQASVVRKFLPLVSLCVGIHSCKTSQHHNFKTLRLPVKFARLVKMD